MFPSFETTGLLTFLKKKRERGSKREKKTTKGDSIFYYFKTVHNTPAYS